MSLLILVSKTDICYCTDPERKILVLVGELSSYTERQSINHHHHLFLNREGRWGTTDDFATSFLHFCLFSTALLDLANSRPVHSLMLSSHLFLCLPCLLPLSLCIERWFWPDLMNGRHVHTTAVCVSSRWSEGLRVVRLPAGF